MTIDLNLEGQSNIKKIKSIKTVLIMVLAYWIDISESRKTYYKKVYDKELEKSRLMNLKKFANPRFINFLLPTRQDGRRLNEINNSLYGALEHGITYELNNPYSCPRMLSIGHAFSHLDSTVDDTTGLGNPNKAHFLLDILIYNANKPFDEIEIGIIRTLIKSRINLLLINDYRIELFEHKSDNNLKKLREMFLTILVIELISEIVGLSKQLNFRVHIIKFENALRQRINCYSTIEDLINYDFFDFMNTFVSSVRFGGGYEDSDMLKLRDLIDLLSESTNNFFWVKEIINLTDKDSFNVHYLESFVLPEFDRILTTKIEKYYVQTENKP
jgi:hypothetical protein